MVKAGSGPVMVDEGLTLRRAADSKRALRALEFQTSSRPGEVELSSVSLHVDASRPAERLQHALIGQWRIGIGGERRLISVRL